MIKKKVFGITLLALMSAGNLSGQPELVDRILATVGVGCDKQVVTLSDVNSKPAFFAGMNKAELEAYIDNQLQYLEAKGVKFGEANLEPSQATMEAKMERIKHALGAAGPDDVALEAKLHEKGLTLTELKEQVFNYHMVSQLWMFTFPDRAVVPLSAIEDYYHKHPESLAAQVHLMVAEVEATKLQELINQFPNAATNKEFYKALDFVDLVDLIAIDKLDEQLRSKVSTAQDGQVCVPQINSKQLEDNQKMQVIKVVKRLEARKKNLEERKAEIIRIIELEEAEKRYKGYLNDLRQRTHICRYLV